MRSASSWPDPTYVARWGIGPHSTADALVWRHPGWILMVRRADDSWALPGGFYSTVATGETSFDAAVRELREETGIVVDLSMWRCKATRGFKTEERQRDPRAWIRTTAHRFDLPHVFRGRAVAGDDALEVRWWKPTMMPSRVYADHLSIIEELTR